MRFNIGDKVTLISSNNYFSNKIVPIISIFDQDDIEGYIIELNGKKYFFYEYEVR